MRVNGTKTPDPSLDSDKTLVICFGASDFTAIKEGFEDIKKNFSKLLHHGGVQPPGRYMTIWSTIKPSAQPF